MVSKVESGFLAKLEKAKGLVSMCEGFYGYNPPGREEKIESMNALISGLYDTYEAEKVLIDQYQTAVDTRLKAYKFEENSIEELLSPIANAFQAFLGRDSDGFKKINNYIKKIKASKLIKVTIDPNQTDADTAIANTEKSFEGMFELFYQLVETLFEYPRYNPTRDDIKAANLHVFANKVAGLNSDVISFYKGLSSTRSKRKAQYEELKIRIQKIKNYLKSEYGINSSEYNLIRGIRI